MPKLEVFKLLLRQSFRFYNLEISNELFAFIGLRNLKLLAEWFSDTLWLSYIFLLLIDLKLTYSPFSFSPLASKLLWNAFYLLVFLYYFITFETPLWSKYAWSIDNEGLGLSAQPLKLTWLDGFGAYPSGKVSLNSRGIFEKSDLLWRKDLRYDRYDW